MELESKDIVPILGVIVVAIISAIITLFMGYRSYEPRRRPRPQLKLDLEILQMIDPTEFPNQYGVVKAEVEAKIAQIYVKRGWQDKKIRMRWSLPVSVFGFVTFTGFSFWSWHLVQTGFTWWVIGTGYGALVGLMYIIMGIWRYNTRSLLVELKKQTGI